MKELGKRSWLHRQRWIGLAPLQELCRQRGVVLNPLKVVRFWDPESRVMQIWGLKAQIRNWYCSLEERSWHRKHRQVILDPF